MSEPHRVSFSKVDLQDAAQAYVNRRYSPTAYNPFSAPGVLEKRMDEQDIYHERLGLLLSFINETFPSPVSEFPPKK